MDQCMVPQYNVRSPRQDGNLKQRHPANRSKFHNIQDVQQSYTFLGFHLSQTVGDTLNKQIGNWR